ncbi:hypothetical protein ISM_02420 [Roseovarius nubinhibens ISM]|uniref:Uncharacterized protein n=1 Tax=Roseovarius nubinhibens (strain ATCC BAA-591 / DSM 15170 / ISM) TaxID=89187 RepID=A3SIC6_ROSNI|nr:hypothetical protein ISM_02420 [Roseovarius nubinhibens ISM]
MPPKLDLLVTKNEDIITKNHQKVAQFLTVTLAS